MAQRITVRVKPDGSLEVAVDGVSGASCHDVTRALEKALGARTGDKRTPEFFQKAAERSTLRQKGSA